MHFFNPVAVLPLVEVIRAAETDDATLATVWDTAKKLRKRPVLSADAPAFIVNRVLTRMTTVLMDALENGNTVDETDEAILRLGLPMAPSVLLQMVGPRVANHVLETLHEAYPDRFPLSETLRNYADGQRRDRRAGRRPPDRRGDPAGRARGDRRRGQPDARRGRDRGRQGRRHRPDPRRRLAVLAGRDHEAPRPDRRSRSASPGGRSPRLVALYTPEERDEIATRLSELLAGDERVGARRAVRLGRAAATPTAGRTSTSS